MLGTVFVVAEQRDGLPTGHAFELCAAARALAARVTAFTWGRGSGELPAQLARHGVTKVFDLGDLGDRLPAPCVAAAIAGEIERAAPREAGDETEPALGRGTATGPGHGASQGPRAEAEPDVPAAVLAPASYTGRDVAARLSARVDRPVLANVVGLELAGGALVSSHAVFGGAKVVRSRVSGPPPPIFLLAAKSWRAEPVPVPLGSPPEVVRTSTGELGPADAARVVGRRAGQHQGPALEDASVVVSGGRGLGSAERYGLVEELARLLGGAAGATRAIVDAGWAPYANQVGQTGKTVKPEVYLAFGISGATQHLVGMRGSGCVIAVNRDPGAPILLLADLGVVGDAVEVLPRLIEALVSRS